MGITCCSIGLITGPLWARPVWGIWWTWDARLTTTFILWLLYVSYLLLRGLLEDPADARLAFGRFRHLRVSRCAARLCFKPPLADAASAARDSGGGEGSGLDPTMAKVLLLCVISMFGVMIPVLIDRYRLERLRHEFDELRLEVENRSADPQSVSDKGCRYEKFSNFCLPPGWRSGPCFWSMKCRSRAACPSCATISSA